MCIIICKYIDPITVGIKNENKISLAIVIYECGETLNQTKKKKARKL